MKAPSFDYVRAASLAQAFELLERHGDDARVLAGGQTLVAALNMRLSEPALLVDITALAELRGIALDGPLLRIGALATHAEIEHSPRVATHAPLLAQAAPHIAHRAIRNLGTLGGSLAHADPAAEWPACMLALEATLLLQRGEAQRRVAAVDFFQGLYATALRPGELLLACEVPVVAPDGRQVFDELVRRHGDYAIAGLAACARLRDGCIQSPRLAFLGLADRPLRAPRTEARLESRMIDERLLAEAEATLREELQPVADLTHGAETKRHLAAVLMKRALRRLAG